MIASGSRSVSRQSASATGTRRTVSSRRKRRSKLSGHRSSEMRSFEASGTQTATSKAGSGSAPTTLTFATPDGSVVGIVGLKPEPKA